MIIETATQASQLKGINAPPTSEPYLQNIHLDAALLLQESSRVELLFSVHPAKLNPKIYRQNMYGFTVPSDINITESDTFPEYCNGHTKVGNETPDIPLFRVYGVPA